MNLSLSALAALLMVSPALAGDLEEMRFRHLWISYGIIWLLVSAFTYATWRRAKANAEELAHLKAKMAELEASK
ncbi:hypothetical protein KKF91_20075 [Myxococcota bacterium]|nr:hypothetical protein [Myxococcota bacterium]MBU1432844.1 hypothetical protein [Myxococcota bacterium]MBU1897528.1 hypothetical protein [Myxococcota bacterium]